MPSHSRAHRQLASWCVLALSAVAAAHAQQPVLTSISVRLEAHRTSIRITEPATILYTLHNDTSEDIWVLFWQTPLRGIWSDLFDIQLDGQPVDYTGLIVEWASPEESDFIHVPAGAEVSATVDLSTAYDMSRRGEYSLRQRVAPYEGLLMKDASGAVMFSRFSSDTVTLWVDRNEANRQGIAPPTLEENTTTSLFSTATPPVFVGCSLSRQNIITQALSRAEALSLQAESRLTATTPKTGYADKDYRTWFGCYDAERYAKVKRNFAAISSTLATQSFTFHCGDDSFCRGSGGFAYAERKVPYHVHLCNRFWGLRLSGVDSRIGALLHETSHFEVVADTEDLTGLTTVELCKLISNTRNPKNRDLPIKNACGYQYFAEHSRSRESGSVAPEITGSLGPPTLIGNGTPQWEILSFRNIDCDPIVRIENRLLRAPPGNWVAPDWENPTLWRGTWQEGRFALQYYCHYSGRRILGPIVNEHVLVDAGGKRSEPIITNVYCAGTGRR